MKALFLSAFLVFAAGCASSFPVVATVHADPIAPPGSWEMKVADDEEAAAAPPVEARRADQPNVASKAKRSLFTLTKKSQ